MINQQRKLAKTPKRTTRTIYLLLTFLIMTILPFLTSQNNSDLELDEEYEDVDLDLIDINTP